MCNAFTELTDAVEQRDRFNHELEIRKKFESPVYTMPEKFLAALEYMPESSGIALELTGL